MNKLILALMIFSTSAYSEDISRIQDCTVLASMAKKVMKLRQNGSDMSKIIKLSEGYGYGIYLTKQAYSQPLWSSAKAKQRAITEFGNKAMLDCLSVEEG